MTKAESDAELLLQSLDMPRYWSAYRQAVKSMEDMDTLERLFVAAMLGTYIKQWLCALHIPQEECDALILGAIKAAERLAERRLYSLRPTGSPDETTAVKPSKGML